MSKAEGLHARSATVPRFRSRKRREGKYIRHTETCLKKTSRPSTTKNSTPQRMIWQHSTAFYIRAGSKSISSLILEMTRTGEEGNGAAKKHTIGVEITTGIPSYHCRPAFRKKNPGEKYAHGLFPNTSWPVTIFLSRKGSLVLI